MDPVRHNRLFKAKRTEQAKAGAADIVQEETHFQHKIGMIKSVTKIGGFGAGLIQKLSCCVCSRKTPSMFLGFDVDRRYYCQDHKYVRGFGQRRIAVIIKTHFLERVGLKIKHFIKSLKQERD